MKKTQTIFVFLSISIFLSMSCKTDVKDKNFKLSDYEKTEFITVIPKNESALISLESDSWSKYYNGSEQKYKGVFWATRKVQLSGFEMCAYEVTQELYKGVMGNNPSYYVETSSDYGKMLSGERQKYRPVENISWKQAIVFCNELTKKTMNTESCVYYSDENFINVYTENDINEKLVYMNPEKKGYRLPTEAEWEFAARGANINTDEWFYAYPGVQTSLEISNYTDSQYDQSLFEYAWYYYSLSGKDNITLNKGEPGYGTHEVGLKKPNSIGLYDMSGNVFEWCFDAYTQSIFYSEDLYKVDGIVINPRSMISSRTNSVARGGCWNSFSKNVCSSYRIAQSPKEKYKDYGIRLVRSL